MKSESPRREPGRPGYVFMAPPSLGPQPRIRASSTNALERQLRLLTRCPRCAQRPPRYPRTGARRAGKYAVRKSKEQFSPEKSKSDWGPRAWYKLHTAAIFFSCSPSEQERIAVHNQIWQFVSTLPCQKCRGHARSYISQHLPNTNNSETLQSWMFNFHNFVNHRLDKPPISYDKYLTKYQDEIQKNYRAQWSRPVRHFQPHNSSKSIYSRFT